MSEKRSQHGYYSGNFPKFSSIVVVENTRNQLHLLNLKKMDQLHLLNLKKMDQLHLLNLKKMDQLHLLNLKKMENFFSYKRRIALPKFSKMLLPSRSFNRTKSATKAPEQSVKYAKS